MEFLFSEEKYAYDRQLCGENPKWKLIAQKVAMERACILNQHFGQESSEEENGFV